MAVEALEWLVGYVERLIPGAGGLVHRALDVLTDKVQAGLGSYVGDALGLVLGSHLTARAWADATALGTLPADAAERASGLTAEGLADIARVTRIRDLAESALGKLVVKAAGSAVPPSTPPTSSPSWPAWPTAPTSCVGVSSTCGWWPPDPDGPASAGAAVDDLEVARAGDGLAVEGAGVGDPTDVTAAQAVQQRRDHGDDDVDPVVAAGPVQDPGRAGAPTVGRRDLVAPLRNGEPDAADVALGARVVERT